MREISFGQYYPRDSVLHRMDPRTKLILVLAFIVLVFFANSFTAFGVITLFVVIAIIISKVPFGKVLRSVRAILFVMVFTLVITILLYRDASEVPLASWWIFRIYKSGIINAAKLVLRLTLLVMGPALLTLTTTPVALTDGLEKLLKPLTYIKIPVHELALIMSIALRLIPILTSEADKIINAQKARCADFESGNLFRRAKSLLPILIPLLLSAFATADDLADAMDSRCYRGAKGRTRMKVLKYHFRDFAALFVMAALFFGILLLRYNWFGFAIIDIITLF